MAVLSAGDRSALLKAYAQELSANFDGLNLTRAQLQAVIDAADDWAEANSASYNTAIPQPQRGVLTARQKAAILMYVIRRRWEVS